MDLEPAHIAEAATVIDPAFRDSPQYVDAALGRALDRTITVKLETANPIRSFKGRGADYLLRGVAPGSTVVCASAGNYGQAIAYCGRNRGVRVKVFVADTINPDKQNRMELLGATVIKAGPDGDAARVAAERYARDHPGHLCLHDGREAAVAEGAGTIGVELDRIGGFDAVVLPVGDGALINGVGCWLKHARPHVRIIGVNAAGAPSMRDSLRAGRQVIGAPTDTIADGIAIRTPFPESLRRAETIVDEMLLVDDTALTEAMLLAARTLGIVPEPAAVAGLAAIAGGLIPERSVACVITGANPRPEQLRALGNGLST